MTILLCRSICLLFIYLCINSSICLLFINLSICIFYLFIHLFVYLIIYLFICLFIYLFVHLFFYLSIYLSIYLSTYPYSCFVQYIPSYLQSLCHPPSPSFVFPFLSSPLVFLQARRHFRELFFLN